MSKKAGVKRKGESKDKASKSSKPKKVDKKGEKKKEKGAGGVDASVAAIAGASGRRPVALVTGAGSGIGRSVALRLAAEGFDLALVGRRLKALEETASMCDGVDDAGVLCVSADVGDVDSAREAVDATLSRFGRLDALVNNAGYAPGLPLAEMDDRADEVDAIVRVNLLGTVYVLGRAWPALAAAEGVGGAGGRVVNVSSIATVDPFFGLGVYAAAKAGVNLLTQAAAGEFGGVEGGGSGGTGSRVKLWSVAPGAVETEMLRGLVSEADLPSDQCLTTDEVAAVIVDCLMDRRGEASGAVIHLRKS